MYRVGSYSACSSCGSTKVEKTVTTLTEDPTKELVMVDCVGCERRRARYYRKKAVRAG